MQHHVLCNAHTFAHTDLVCVVVVVCLTLHSLL
jgi:hypothetical protein